MEIIVPNNGDHSVSGFSETVSSSSAIAHEQEFEGLVETTEGHIRIEREQKHIAKYAVITIGGQGSVGNSSTADNAAADHGIPPENVFHAGKIFREYAKELDPTFNEDSLDSWECPDWLHELVDEKIVELILSASVENPIIIEGKLSGALLRDLEYQYKLQGRMHELPRPRLAILKAADIKKRVQIAQLKKGSKGLKTQEIKRQTSKRDADDKITWNRVHPWLIGYSNILTKNARDLYGNPIYPVIVDATNHASPEDDLNDLNEKLLSLGLIVKKPREMEENTPVLV